MTKLPNNIKWYEDIALLEGAHEVSAGYIDAVLDGAPETGHNKAKIECDHATSAAETRRAFARIVRELRLDKGLSYKELSNRLNVEEGDLRLMEEDFSYRAAPRTLVQMAEFYAIPSRIFLSLAGAVHEQSPVEKEAVKWAAHSAALDVLSTEQKQILHEFVRSLRKGYKQ